MDALGERSDGKWSSFEVGIVVPRQNGKGALLEIRCLAGLTLFGEQLILHSAHQMKTAKEAFRRIEKLFENWDDLRRRVKKVDKSKGEEGIELLTGQRLRFVARSKDSARGFSGDCVILDEAYALDQDELDALLPTMSAMPNPQVWYTSTPPLGPATALASLRKRGMAGSRRVAYFEWSPAPGFAPTPKKDPATDADWQALRETNPAMGIRLSEEFAETERATLDDGGYARERLGVWPPEADGSWLVISEDQWEARLDPESEIDGTVAVCIDTTPTRSHSCISVAGRRDDGDRHVEVAVHREGVTWVVRRLKKIIAEQNVCVVVVDGAGPAASLLPDLEKYLGELAPPIPLHKLGAQEAAAAFGAFYDGIVPPGEREDEDDDELAGESDSTPIRHLDQLPLTLALAGAQTRPLSGGKAWSRVDLDVDLTPLVSATGALYGHSRYGHLVPETTPPPATARSEAPDAANLWRPTERLKL